MPITQHSAGHGTAIHPGKKLQEEFMAGTSASALAMALRVPVTRISEIVRERRGVTADTALRLARYFQTTPQYWMQLQMDYDLATALDEAEAALLEEIHPAQSSKTAASYDASEVVLQTVQSSILVAEENVTEILNVPTAESAIEPEVKEATGGWRSRFTFNYGGPLPGCKAN